MIDIIEVLKVEMIGCSMTLRQLKKNRVRYLYHDPITEQDVVATVYFPEDFNCDGFHAKMYFSELVQIAEWDKDNGVCIRCKVQQL